MLKCGKTLKRLLIYSLITILALPFGMILMFAGIGKASAIDKITMPDQAKIVLTENRPGSNDFVQGFAGAVKPNAQIEISTSKNFVPLFRSLSANKEGGFGPISLGDNVAATFFLRYQLNNQTSPFVTLKNDITSPVIKGVDNLKTTTYQKGEVISFVFYGEQGARYSAKLGSLDTSFPEVVRLNQAQDGSVNLVTPKLTSSLNPGYQVIEISAVDQAGNITTKKIPVFLKKPAQPVISTKVVGEHSITLYWQQIKTAQEYQIQIQEAGQSLVESKTISAPYHSYQIVNLKSGTTYHITVIAHSASGSDSARAVVTTKGQAMGGEITPTVPKQIGFGASTKSAQVANTPAPVKTVEPTQTPEPFPATEEETEENSNGWNRLLLAISILIIAVGVAIGGYYGYEWMQSRDKDNTPKSGNRW